MKPPIRHYGLIALAVAGVVGSLLGARALAHAIMECRNLYRIDTVGSQLEGELEYETQESRRAFLYALATADPNEQLPYIDQAREASRRVQDRARRLRGLQAPEVADWLDRFESAWANYSAVRDEIVADILEGNIAGSLSAERGRGQSSFTNALQSLHSLKSVLERRAGHESEQVDRTLRRCAAGLAGFTLCVLLIVTLLSKANRDRHRALESLRANNIALMNAREMERRRAAVLEMVSTHAPLTSSLKTIAELAPERNPRTGAALWAATGAILNFQVAANLPQDLVVTLGQRLLPLKPEPSQESGNGAASSLAGRFGFYTSARKTLQDAAGRTIGMLEIFARDENFAFEKSMLDQMADLAAVAIENTLLYERLAFQAQHDVLTELPNRLLFQDRVQQALQLARRHRKRVAVLWIDLDRYKQINDALGHRVGDEVLCEVSRRLKECLRESDTVARVGGDEFTILAQDLSSPAASELVCRKILAALSLPMILGEHEVAITASAGVSVFPEHGEDPIALMRHADLAMYGAKRQGGNCFQVFRPALADSLLRRNQIERELKSALERDEFSLHYQPLVNSLGRVQGLEALLRWDNAALGRVSPGDFVPVAEEMGMIPAIGEWVIRKACSTGARWLAAGLALPDIAVNVSAVQFVAKDLASTVEHILRDTRFPANKLVIEITETVLMNNLGQALEQMGALRRQGVQFAIDDFGTGYSSLSQLRNLPVDCVKIDRSFVKDLEAEGTGSATLVRGIITLAHSLQLEVVAEGIETEQQLNLLRSMGCDISQGFFLHKPMPADQVEKLLEPVPADPGRAPGMQLALNPA